MVQPQARQVFVTVTFAGRRSKADVQARIARLAAAFGAQIAGLRISERARSARRPGVGPRGRVLVRAEALLDAAAQIRDGGIWLQPYLAAFGDLPQWELWIWVARLPELRPLRHYAGPGLTVDLLSAGNPYRYVFRRGNPKVALPTLPLTESPAAAANSRPVRTTRSGSAYVVVSLVAVACGAAVFLALLAVARARKAR